MKFPFTYLGKPAASVLEQKRAAWTGTPKASENDRFELALIAGLMLCTLVFLLLFLLMLGQLP